MVLKNKALFTGMGLFPVASSQHLLKKGVVFFSFLDISERGHLFLFWRTIKRPSFLHVSWRTGLDVASKSRICRWFRQLR